MRFILVLFICSIGFANTIDVVRQRNVDTYITFPIVDINDNVVSGAAGLDSEYVDYNDSNAPGTFKDCSNEATEIGSTGVYYLSIAQAEINYEYVTIRVQTSTTDAVDTIINLSLPVGDPLLIASTDDGGVINVTSGRVELASNGLDQISTTDPTGVPSNFREAVLWVCMRLGLNKVIKTSSEITTYADDGTTTVTTNDITTVGTTQTLSAAE